MEKKSNETKLTQTEISKQLNYSHSPNKRYRDDIIMDTPYKKTGREKQNQTR